jgi:hypothetical protein
LKRIQKKNREWLNGKDKKTSFYVFICFKCLEHKKFRIAGRQAGRLNSKCEPKYFGFETIRNVD